VAETCHCQPRNHHRGTADMENSSVPRRLPLPMTYHQVHKRRPNRQPAVSQEILQQSILDIHSERTANGLPIIIHLCIIRPHRSTTYVDAAYCYQLSSVVCRSVFHTSEPCKNGCTDRAAVWVENWGAPREPCITWESRSPVGRGNFDGETGEPL